MTGTCVACERGLAGAEALSHIQRTQPSSFAMLYGIALLHFDQKFTGRILDRSLLQQHDDHLHGTGNIARLRGSERSWSMEPPVTSAAGVGLSRSSLQTYRLTTGLRGHTSTSITNPNTELKASEDDRTACHCFYRDHLASNNLEIDDHDDFFLQEHLNQATGLLALLSRPRLWIP
jgi:hypothetical protein